MCLLNCDFLSLSFFNFSGGECAVLLLNFFRFLCPFFPSSLKCVQASLSRAYLMAASAVSAFSAMF